MRPFIEELLIWFAELNCTDLVALKTGNFAVPVTRMFTVVIQHELSELALPAAILLFKLHSDDGQTLYQILFQVCIFSANDSENRVFDCFLNQLLRDTSIPLVDTVSLTVKNSSASSSQLLIGRLRKWASKTGENNSQLRDIKNIIQQSCDVL